MEPPRSALPACPPELKASLHRGRVPRPGPRWTAAGHGPSPTRRTPVRPKQPSILRRPLRRRLLCRHSLWPLPPPARSSLASGPPLGGLLPGRRAKDIRARSPERLSQGSCHLPWHQASSKAKRPVWRAFSTAGSPPPLPALHLPSLRTLLATGIPKVPLDVALCKGPQPQPLGPVERFSFSQVAKAGGLLRAQHTCANGRGKQKPPDACSAALAPS